MNGQFILGLPVLELDIENRKIKVLLDTGFNGEIMLSEDIIHDLKLESIGLTDYMTVSGDKYIANVYIGKTRLFDEEKEVAVLSSSSNFSLAGLQLFHFCKIVLERHKEIMEIEKTG